MVFWNNQTIKLVTIILWCMFFYRLNLWVLLNCLLALNRKKHSLPKPLAFLKVCEGPGVGLKPCFGRRSIAFWVCQKESYVSRSHRSPYFRWGLVLWKHNWLPPQAVSWEADAITSSSLCPRMRQCGLDLGSVTPHHWPQKCWGSHRSCAEMVVCLQSSEEPEPEVQVQWPGNGEVSHHFAFLLLRMRFWKKKKRMRIWVFFKMSTISMVVNIYILSFI